MAGVAQTFCVYIKPGALTLLSRDGIPTRSAFTKWLLSYSSYLSLRLAVVLFFTSIFVGALGFVFIEGYSYLDAVYMSVITLSTVGFGEVGGPLSDAGKVYTSFLIIFNLATYTYAISAFTYFVTNGNLFKTMTDKLVQRRIDKLSGHVVVCGYGRFGKEVVSQFEQHNIPFVVIEQDQQAIVELLQEHDEYLYIADDATHEDSLIRAGIERAHAMVTVLPNDTDNVFTVLTARQLSPRLNIVSRSKDSKAISKLRLAGADHVIMPEQVGGFYMATLVSKPGAIEFFSFMNTHFDADIGLEEIRYEDLPESCKPKSIAELEIRKVTGANIIAYHAPDGSYIVNPPPGLRLQPGGSFVLLGSREQLDKLRAYLELA
ncbi:MAG TPA: potassium channel protein [Phaeodactylibacter sp.]|nr:potassium channel protein [Phaeodactylibacter sp.]